MAQSALIGVVPNDAGSGVRADINEVDLAIATLSSGTSFPGTPVANQLCLRSDQSILYRRNNANTAWVVVENYGATVAPTSSNDDSQFYRRGSWWFGASLSGVYVCLDASTSAAVWADVTASASTSPSGNDYDLQYRIGSIMGSDSNIRRMASGLLYSKNLAAGYWDDGSGSGDWSPNSNDGWKDITRSASFTVWSTNFTPPASQGMKVTNALITNSSSPTPITVSVPSGSGSTQWQKIIGAASPFTVTSHRHVQFIGINTGTATSKRVSIGPDTA